MTVKELIDQLSEMPMDGIIRIDVDRGPWSQFYHGMEEADHEKERQIPVRYDGRKFVYFF